MGKYDDLVFELQSSIKMKTNKIQTYIMIIDLQGSLEFSRILLHKTFEYIINIFPY
jgi:hypothetical protein